MTKRKIGVRAHARRIGRHRVYVKRHTKSIKGRKRIYDSSKNKKLPKSLREINDFEEYFLGPDPRKRKDFEALGGKKNYGMMGALYPTKKALKESIGQELKHEETSMFGPEYKSDGKVTVVGPSPLERKWYATVTMKDDKIEKVE